MRTATRTRKRLAILCVGITFAAGLTACEMEGETQGSQPLASARDTLEIEAPAATRDARRRQHVRAIEQAYRLNWNAFVEAHFAPSLRQAMTASQLAELRDRMQEGSRNVGSALLEIDGKEFILKLGGAEGQLDIRFTLEDAAPFNITDISAGGRLASTILPAITDSNLDAVLDRAEAEGFNGVVFAFRDGEVIARRALGYADAVHQVPMRLDTIFDVGSQPTEFTIALAHIAAAQGQLDLDDRVSQYIGEMPEDRRAMTVRHLLEGRSGLPDYLDRESDWDPDLAWLSRQGLIERAKREPLGFAPGQGEAHSHAALSLLAAIVEIATRRPYYDYLKEKILDPAGMTHTGMYGSTPDVPASRFAVGPGPRTMGLPNIPPNWGRASWLVIGSGGMYSTLDDQLKFKHYVANDDDVPSPLRQRFSAAGLELDGSERGFERYEARNRQGDVVLIMTNSETGDPVYRALTKRLGEFISVEQL